MTVSSAQNKVSYAGDGSTTVFSVPFLFQANADITAILRDGQGAETTWVEGTDYTLTGAGNPSGGTLTATTAPATGEKLTIKRVVPLTQGTDYPEGGQFPAQAHEDALDRGTMADQQLQEQIDRTVKLKATSALSNIDFPEPGADKGFKWNAGGTALQLTAGDPDAVNPATQAAADAAASSESAAASSESAAASSESAAAASATAASSSESAAAASATAASSSESAAASSETNAATSKTDAEAAAGAVAYKWLFDSSVSMGDPGTGDVRLNNATLSAVTQIAISAKIADVGNPDVSAFIVTWDDSNHSPRGTIVIRLSGTPATFVIYSINGAITDNGIWLQIPVAHVAGNGSLTDTDKVFIHFIRSGDDGTGTGDLLAANNLSDVADVPTARTNLGLGTAAVENVGVADGDVPQMDATGYPAADGSQITNVGGINRYEITVSAGEMIPQGGTNPPLTVRTVGSGVNQVDYEARDFDQTTQEGANFVVRSPENWDLGAIAVEAIWTAQSGTAGDGVRWQFRALAAGHDDAIVAFTSNIGMANVTFTAAVDLHFTTGSFTPNGTPAAGDFIFCKIDRQPGSGFDDLPADANLIAVRVKFTTTG